MYNFIVNPVAGYRRATNNMARISRFLTLKKIPFNVYYTTSDGGAKTVTAELERKGVDNIIAVGGDGTFSEVLNGLTNTHSVILGYIPSGTGNDFAYALKASKNPIKAMTAILQNRLHKIDYIEGNGFRCLNIVGCGLDVEVLKLYNAIPKPKGKIQYLNCLLKVLNNFKFYPLDIEVDGEKLPANEYLLAAACNGNKFGGDLNVSPRSDIQDGKINLVLIKKMKKNQIVSALLDFLGGKHIDKDYCEEKLCENIKIMGSCANTINCDGEVLSDITFEARIIKDGLTIYLP